eukprot:CAMPEP_0180799910 /NCGR_PEP_ID=MMETSP1038_2-20121128/58810_1 /TAXON_ID=632150 /ORGANISM="Azadinium spinosum, Strain 3D9" /LENGTH=89 /DNA_ID=CAMNT_0022839579 /DNA_START=95 /DNA_END=360 /DNA_ORIENTATION=-
MTPPPLMTEDASVIAELNWPKPQKQIMAPTTKTTPELWQAGKESEANAPTAAQAMMRKPHACFAPSSLSTRSSSISCSKDTTKLMLYVT